MVMDNLRKVAHFLAIKSTTSSRDITQSFTKTIVRLHGIPKMIMLDRDSRFNSKFWKEQFVGLGIEFAFSTSSSTKKWVNKED